MKICYFSGPPSFSNPGLPQQQLQLGGVNQPPSIPPAGSGGYVSNGGLAGDLHFPHHHGGPLPMQQTSVPTPPQPSSSNNSAHPPAPSVGSLASSFNNMTMQGMHFPIFQRCVKRQNIHQKFLYSFFLTSKASFNNYQPP